MTPANVPITEVWQRTNWDNWTTAKQYTDHSQMGDDVGLGFAYGLRTQQHVDIVPTSWTYRTGVTMNIASAGTQTFSFNLTDPLDLTVIDNGQLILNLIDFPTSITSGYIALTASDSSTTGELDFPAGDGSTVTQRFNNLSGVNLASISSVEFGFTATSACSVQVNGVRWVDPSWVLSTVDFNNHDHNLSVPVPIVGETPIAIPTIWRCADPPGSDDPQPIDVTIGVMFNSGSQTAINSFNVFFRGTSNVPVLEGVINGQIEGVLNGYTLANNNNLPPSIESITSPNAFNIQICMEWGNFNGTTGYQVTASNSITPSLSYQYNTLVSGDIINTKELSSNSLYMLWAKLQGNTVEIMIYPFNDQYYLDSAIFVSAPILDSALFYRTPGHIGFNCTLVDTDAYISSIRPHKTIFAQYRSNPFTSNTPVIGAQLYAQSTPPVQLLSPQLTPLVSSDNVEPVMGVDSGHSLSGNSVKIIFGKSSATQTYQGFTTDYLTPSTDQISGIVDFDSLSASFDIWIESSAISHTNTPFIGLLTNEWGYGLPVLLPNIIPNKWNHGVINFLTSANAPAYVISNGNTILSSPVAVNGLLPTGLYKFSILYVGEASTTMWVDNIHIYSKAVNWQGRVTSDNPFIQDLFPWVPFNDTINESSDGIRFTQPGKSLQIGADALTQDAEIYNGYTLVPIYAQLGRFITGNKLPGVIPTEDIVITTTKIQSDQYQFGCAITGSTGQVYNIEWSFGDGNYAYSQHVSGNNNDAKCIHTYSLGSPSFSTYYVTASVMDDNGNRGYGSTVLSLT